MSKRVEGQCVKPESLACLVRLVLSDGQYWPLFSQGDSRGEREDVLQRCKATCILENTGSTNVQRLCWGTR